MWATLLLVGWVLLSFISSPFIGWYLAAHMKERELKALARPPAPLEPGHLATRFAGLHTRR